MHGCFKIGVKAGGDRPHAGDQREGQSQWQDFPLEQHKRRRCFVKVLTPHRRSLPLQPPPLSERQSDRFLQA